MLIMPFLLLRQLNLLIILGIMVCANCVFAQGDTIRPYLDTEEVGEEARYYPNRIVPPSVSGRYWTHKHEKYFYSFDQIKADSGNVVGLYLSCSGGWQIPPEIERFVNLKRLEIYYGDAMLKLPSQVWKLKQLENVVIQCYDTTITLSDSLSEWSALKRLEIRGALREIPKSIGQLSNLEELFLYSGKFIEMPKEIGDLSNLKTLVIRSMELTTLPASIGNLKNLKKLQIECNLSSIPSEIGNLTQLEELELWNTYLEALPPEMGKLTQLKSLDIHSPNLRVLPKEFGELKELTKLELEGNQLTTLPDEICQLTKLAVLNLGHNKLTALPHEIGKMTALKQLDVSDNQLTTFPPGIGELKNLMELEALSNPLGSLPAQITKLNPYASVNVERAGLLKIPDSVWRFINHNGCYISKVPTTIAGNKLSYYLNQPSIDPAAKLFVKGKLSLMYDGMTYDLLQLLDTVPDENKDFYVFVINAVLNSKVTDRGERVYDYYPYSEIQEICSALLVQRPCTFFRDIRHGEYKASYGKWMETIGGLHYDYEYTETVAGIKAKLRVCGSAYLKEVDEVMEPLFYSEK